MVEQNNNGSRIVRKLGIFFLLFPSIMHIVIYTIYLVNGMLIFDDLAYSELTWIQLTGTYSHLAYLVSEYIRMMGIAVILLEMFVIYGIYLIFWKASKSALALTAASSAVPLILELVLTYPVIGVSIPYMMYIMLTIMVGLGMGIAGKELFNNNKIFNKRKGMN